MSDWKDKDPKPAVNPDYSQGKRTENNREVVPVPHKTPREDDFTQRVEVPVRLPVLPPKAPAPTVPDNPKHTPENYHEVRQSVDAARKDAFDLLKQIADIQAKMGDGVDVTKDQLIKLDEKVDQILASLSGL